MKQAKKLFYIAIIGTAVCFGGDLLLGCFYPSERIGIFNLFPAFSEEWVNASPIRFVLGGLCGVIALPMMFCGFYAIYKLLKAQGSKYDKSFLAFSAIFSSVGILYHCVFAMSGWLYNQLATVDIILAKQISEQAFTSFISIASFAAIGFAFLSITIFLVAVEGTWGNRVWVLVNPLLFMGVLIATAMVLPANAIVNGVFDWGQQSISLFIFFFMFSKLCNPNKKSQVTK